MCVLLLQNMEKINICTCILFGNRLKLGYGVTTGVLGCCMRKLLFVSLFSFLAVAGVFSQTVVPDSVYREVDAVISQPGAPGLGDIISSYGTHSWYPRLEDFVLKRSRQLIINDDLDQASAVSLALVDANLDNVEAFELYQSIERAKERREEERQREAEDAALELHKQQVQEARIREDVDKTYKALVNPTSGQTVYLDQQVNSQYRDVNWDAMVGLGVLSHVQDPDKSAIKYGLSVSGSVIFRGEGFSAGADIIGEVLILTLTGDEAINWKAGGVFLLANNSLSRNAFIRLGYCLFGFDSGSEEYPEKTFGTPVAGFEFRDIRVGSSGFFQMGADWYAGHLYDKDILAAMGFHMALTAVFADMPEFDVFIKAGIRDSLFLINGGVRNDAKLTLSIGVGNYE